MTLDEGEEFDGEEAVWSGLAVEGGVWEVLMLGVAARSEVAIGRLRGCCASKEYPLAWVMESEVSAIAEPVEYRPAVGVTAAVRVLNVRDTI